MLHPPHTLKLIPHPTQLERTVSLRGAISFNLLDMVGAGPFITLPLLIATMGGPQAMLGWLLGALIALADGLVWSELGAALPVAGGTYAYLRQIFPGRTGQALSFLFLFQVFFSCPLSIASAAIGLSQYATFLFPALVHHTALHPFHLGPLSGAVQLGPTTAVAVAVVLLAMLLLFRNLTDVGRLSLLMLAVVLTAFAAILLTGLLRGHISQAVSFPTGAFHLTPAFFAGLASAMLLATYDYWGYYNVALLGGEIKDPGRTIPRAVLLSIGLVAVLYLGMTVSVLSVLRWQDLLPPSDPAQAAHSSRAIISLFIAEAWTPVLGPHIAHNLGVAAAVLIIVTAFAGAFALLLGYSRIPYAAASRGEFFRIFARLHPTGRFPYVSLLALGIASAIFCFFSLAEVIAALVVIRILLQFLTQHIGVMVLRRTQPSLPRPFCLWLYPLPPLFALAGFTFILLARPNFSRQLLFASGIILVGLALFFLRSRNGAVSNPTSATSSQ